MIAIQIGNGGQDAQGSQRGREYDAVSGVYAQFVEREVLPLVEKNADVKLAKILDGRATIGLSSSGAAAFTMAWFYPDLYHRVLGRSRRRWSTSNGRMIRPCAAVPGNITAHGRGRPVPNLICEGRACSHRPSRPACR